MGLGIVRVQIAQIGQRTERLDLGPDIEPLRDIFNDLGLGAIQLVGEEVVPRHGRR